MFDERSAAAYVFEVWGECAMFFGSTCDPEAVQSALIDSYTEPGRYYHNLIHIATMLEMIGEEESNPDRYFELAPAVLFHDFIYDAQAKDNEEQSSEYAATCLPHYNVPKETIDIICELILCTKNHQILPNIPGSALMIDADLSILGSEPPLYDAYAKAIRKEYAFVPQDRYRKGRIEFLQRFLDQPTIYKTPRIEVSHGSQARANMEREIATLNS